MTSSIEDMARKYIDFMNEGLYIESGLPSYDIDPDELDLGIDVELEHTSDENIATKIALDHLAERSDYYTRLKKAGL